MFQGAVYIFPGSVYIFSSSRIGRPIVAANISIAHRHLIRNWDWDCAIPFSGNICSEFSVLCLCSVGQWYCSQWKWVDLNKQRSIPSCSGWKQETFSTQVAGGGLSTPSILMLRRDKPAHSKSVWRSVSVQCCRRRRIVKLSVVGEAGP